MKILEHGSYYTKNKTITCLCGCKFEYESSDTYRDLRAYPTCPPEIQTYVLCPECNSRINLNKTYINEYLKNKGEIL